MLISSPCVEIETSQDKINGRISAMEGNSSLEAGHEESLESIFDDHSSATSEDFSYLKPVTKVNRRICGACKEPSAPGSLHSFHYGGVVCFSCKAFFRRAHQGEVGPDYSCTFDGRCDVNPKTRRHCQKCRYQKCLLAGLQPELVLTAEQKKVRFRRLLKKQQKKKKAENVSNSTKKKPPRTRNLSRHSLDSGESTEFSLSHESNQKTEMDSTNESVEWITNTLDPSFYSMSYESISNKFASSFTGIDDPVFIHTIRKVESFHYGDCTETVKLEELGQAYFPIAKQFYRFASFFREFDVLSDSLKQQLIMFNTPLYVQFLITEYLGSHSGQMQLQFLNDLSPGQTRQPSGFSNRQDDRAIIHFLSLGYFNSMIQGLFVCESDLISYDCQVGDIQTIIDHRKSFGFRALMSYLILFNLDQRLCCGSTEIENVMRVKEGLLQWYIQTSSFNLDLFAFIKTLENLSKFHITDTGRDISKIDYEYDLLQSNISKQLVIPYTDGEEKWLQRQFFRISEVFRSVRFGEDIINEFTMYSLGVPLSKKYFKNVISIMLERQKQVYKLHEEFRSLPHLVQSGLICMNSLITSALFGARFETCKTGREQLEISQTDITNWSGHFSRVFNNLESLKPIYLRDSFASMPHLVNSENLEHFVRTVREIQDVVTHPEIFKMMLVIILTRPLGKDVQNPLENLHTSYKLLLSRRTTWLVESNKLAKGLAAESVTKRVFGAIDQLEGLSKLLLLIMINS